MITLPDVLQAAMRARGHKPETLARRLGCDRSLVTRWLNGTREPSLQQLMDLADVLDCDLLRDVAVGRWTRASGWDDSVFRRNLAVSSVRLREDGSPDGIRTCERELEAA